MREWWRRVRCHAYGHTVGRLVIPSHWAEVRIRCCTTCGKVWQIEDVPKE